MEYYVLLLTIIIRGVNTVYDTFIQNGYLCLYIRIRDTELENKNPRNYTISCI